MSIDVVEVVIWRESSVSGGSGAVQMFLRWQQRLLNIVVMVIQITLKQMLSDFIGIRVNRAKESGMGNITSSVNSLERSGINTILHELNPLFTINVTMRDIKSKNVYSRVNSKATTQWRKTESANGVHLEGVASDNRSS